MNEELIILYLTQQSSEVENRTLLNWVRQSDSNRQEFIDFCTLWNSAKINQFDAQKAYTKFVQRNSQSKNSISTKSRKRIAFWKPLVAIAAVAMLFVGLFFLHNPAQQQEFITVANNNTQPQQVTLPDNSEIILQQGAQITYPAQFADNERKIEANGVLYCKIARNEQAPFMIDCKNFTVEVLGTEFEVETTEGNAHVIVTLGKVRVCNTTTKAEVELSPNERVDVKQYSLRKTLNNDENFLSWNTGLLKFSNTPLSTVFSDLQRHYKCNITITDNAINACKITGTYQDMTLKDILEIIHSAFPYIHFTHSHTNADEITVHL